MSAVSIELPEPNLLKARARWGVQHAYTGSVIEVVAWEHDNIHLNNLGAEDLTIRVARELAAALLAAAAIAEKGA